jgi:hypothetical protein
MDQLEPAFGADDSFDDVAEVEMILWCSTTAILVGTLWASLLGAAEFSNYRGFQFGTQLAAVAKQAGVKLSEAKVVHQRPAVIQELEWRPRFPFEANATQVDPVRDSLLRFYNGDLFEIVTTYDRYKVQGMTEADMVESLSVTYGTATKPAVEIPYHSSYGEVAAVLARWEDSEYSYNLIRTGDQASFALILNSKRLNALAQAAIVEAVRLDVLEAPERATALTKKREAEDRILLDKAKSVNMPNFRP